MKGIIQSTTEEEKEIAIHSLSQIMESSENIFASGKESVKIQIENFGKPIRIPKRALTLLFEIIATMSDGKAMTLIPSDAEISTQEAANILNVSRPHLIKLLEQGMIPHRKVGSHRRILLDDITDFKSALQKEREKQLKYLAEQAQELNMGY